jgi:hypothetical protein
MAVQRTNAGCPERGEANPSARDHRTPGATSDQVERELPKHISREEHQGDFERLGIGDETLLKVPGA